MERWKTIVAVAFLIFALGFFGAVVGGQPLFSATAAGAESADSLPSNAIPVRCDDSIAAGTKETVSCVRADTGAGFTDIPGGHYLLVTDIVINRNSLATSGDYYATIGANSTGILPAQPRLEFSGTPLVSDFYSFQAPYIILEAGESLQARNDSSSDFPIDIFVSGFLVDDVTYRVLMQNYLPALRRSE